MTTPSQPDFDTLPAPPSGRTGWPWTGRLLRTAPAPTADTAWPTITIVTPSYNQAQFLEETIRSVLLQEYPNLEYFVMDGGSTDGSREIIERYAPWLTGWVSEPDRGQSHAINRGFARATGDWLGWLNSDDCFAPSALHALMREALEQSANFVAGASIRFRDGETHIPKRLQPAPQAFDPAILCYTQGFDQPACLWRRELFERAGPLEEETHYVFDWRFFNRCAPHMQVAISEAAVVCYRVHAAHKTGSGGNQRWQEVLEFYEENLEGDDLVAFQRVRRWLDVLRWLTQVRRRSNRFGLYYAWLLTFRLIRYGVIDRPPPLNPHILRLLELPFRVEQNIGEIVQGKESDGSVASVLAAFTSG